MIKKLQIEKNQELIKFIVCYWKKLDNPRTRLEVIGNLKSFRNTGFKMNGNKTMFDELSYLIELAEFIINSY